MQAYAEGPGAEPEGSGANERPVVWALLGVHHGDNEQVLALAHSLDYRVVEKPLSFNPLFVVPNLLLGATLATLTAECAKQLAPPWPDLAIGAGRRTAPAALWIRRQSGGRTRLVRIGRPRAPLASFDLVIATPQYQLPPMSNVVQLALPFGAVRKAGQAELAEWRVRFSDMPRPWTAVLVGGSAWPYTFGRTAARRLAAALNSNISREGGAALVSTSPRTDSGATACLRASLHVPHYFHGWRQNAANPYGALLALADRFIVTADSVSMLADACRTGKPVAIFDLLRRRDPVSLAGQWLSRHARRDTMVGRLLRRATISGVLAPPRAIAEVHELLRMGMAVTSFEAERPIGMPAAGVEVDLALRVAVGRVRSLNGANGVIISANHSNARRSRLSRP